MFLQGLCMVQNLFDQIFLERLAVRQYHNLFQVQRSYYVMILLSPDA